MANRLPKLLAQTWGGMTAGGAIIGAYYGARGRWSFDSAYPIRLVCKHETFYERMNGAIGGSVYGALVFGPLLPWTAMTAIASIKKD